MNGPPTPNRDPRPEPRPAFSSWDDYRRRCWRFWAALIAFGPGALLSVALVDRVLGLHSLAAIGPLVFLGLFAAAGTHMVRFPCPHCGRPFFYRRRSGNPLAAKCKHCGWPKWKAG